MNSNHTHKTHTQFTKINFLKTILLLTTIFLFTLSTPQTSSAESFFVDDQAGLLSEETKQAIIQANESDFKQLPGSPQFVLKTIKKLPKNETIETYANETFQTLGIGDKDLNNGFLFVIAVSDRKYRLEVGYGVEDVITDSMKRAIVPTSVEQLFREEKYDQGLTIISHNIITIVNERYGNYEAAKKEIQDIEQASNSYDDSEYHYVEPKKNFSNYIGSAFAFIMDHFVLSTLVALSLFIGFLFLRSFLEERLLKKPLFDSIQELQVRWLGKVAVREKAIMLYVKEAPIRILILANFDNYKPLQHYLTKILFTSDVIDYTTQLGKYRMHHLTAANKLTYCTMCLEISERYYEAYSQSLGDFLTEPQNITQAKEQLQPRLKKSDSDYLEILQKIVQARVAFMQTRKIVQVYVKKHV
ncbi:hypothetical protein IGL98_003479 [Enterococcus sp. DIV0840]|uniref:TPM domain-containing protein n=1 Tax=Enterococcus TaxID=1350 RepID=UPI001A8BF487|nr:MULTISPECIES: TPM domain-containing protein [Enterococcus]MBO0435943.1 TPM domain-containing protein [Enterococcus sp. DIV0849a]MBO0473764.1 TPM domain-containing protein [Enterococcus ureasiticus]